MSSTRHLIKLADLSAAELRRIVARGLEFKQKHKVNLEVNTLTGRVLGLLFLQPSTRTRVSFEVAMAHLGGACIDLDVQQTQLSRGETLADTARVLSSMCDAVAVRSHDHAQMLEFVAASSAPVINALSSLEHPCQVLADVMTFEELRGPVAGCKVAWIGDCNNVCHSWIRAAELCGFELHVAAPNKYSKISEGYCVSSGSLTLGNDPVQAAAGADCVVTDVWYGVGEDIACKQQRLKDFAGYQVDSALLAKAKPGALFMHCLPAHRGEEVHAEVIDGPQSAVWAEATNRVFAQKALLEFLLA